MTAASSPDPAAEPSAAAEQSVASHTSGGAPSNANGRSNGRPGRRGGNGAHAVATLAGDRTAVGLAAATDAAVPLPMPVPHGGMASGGRFNIRTFESLRLPAFRWFLFSSLGSFGAMNMQMLVRGYLVFTLTGSYAALGTIALVGSLPGLIMTMPGGLIADRFRRKRVVQAGQLGSAALALLIGLLLLAGELKYWHLLVCAAGQAMIFSLMMPSRQSMLPEVVGMQRYMNAAALNTGGMTVAQMSAPAFAGFMLGVVGAGWVYMMMTACYIFSVLMLFKVDDQPVRAIEASDAAGPGMHQMRRRGPSSFRDIGAGLAYVVRDPMMRLLLGATLMITLFSMPYQMLLPGFVLDVLKGGPGLLGTLQSVSAIGALAGAMMVASIPNRHRGKLFLGGAVVIGVSLIAFSFAQALWITALTMVVIAFGSTVRQALSQVLVQTYVADAYRGRAMSVYMMEMHIISFGTFFVGILASVAGPRVALGSMAVALLLMVGLLSAFSRLRHVD